MLKILIVDDEEIILSGISKKIKRLTPQFDIIGCAGTAAEALEIVKKQHPDIVITDIKLPGIDGLEFIEMAQKICSNTEYIIISAYEDFHYAQKAISLGVADYLIKPVNNDRLLNILSKLENKISHELEEREKMLSYERKAKSGEIHIKNKYLNDLINENNMEICNQIINTLSTFETNFIYGNFTAITIAVKTFDRANAISSHKDIPLLKLSMINMSEETLSGMGNVIAFENLAINKHIVVIINHKLEVLNGVSYIDTLCENLLSRINKFLGVDVAIGIGRSYKSISKISVSYTESLTACMQTILLGNYKALNIASIPEVDKINFIFTEEDERLLQLFINSGEYNKAYKLIDQAFVKIKRTNLSYQNIKILWMQMELMLSRILKEAGGTWNNVFNKNILSSKQLSSSTSLNEFIDCIKASVFSVSDYINNLRKSDGKKGIDEIKEYINKYYYTNVNLNQLSEKYYLNSCYLSQLFKQETGSNFIDYLTNVRLEKAKNLLLDTNLKIYQVSEMLGYNSFRYFSDLFSKMVGCTPSKFRESNYN